MPRWCAFRRRLRSPVRRATVRTFRPSCISGLGQYVPCKPPCNAWVAVLRLNRQRRGAVLCKAAVLSRVARRTSSGRRPSRRCVYRPQDCRMTSSFVIAASLAPASDRISILRNTLPRPVTARRRGWRLSNCGSDEEVEIELSHATSPAKQNGLGGIIQTRACLICQRGQRQRGCFLQCCRFLSPQEEGELSSICLLQENSRARTSRRTPSPPRRRPSNSLTTATALSCVGESRHAPVVPEARGQANLTHYRHDDNKSNIVQEAFKQGNVIQKHVGVQEQVLRLHEQPLGGVLSIGKNCNVGTEDDVSAVERAGTEPSTQVTLVSSGCAVVCIRHAVVHLCLQFLLAARQRANLRCNLLALQAHHGCSEEVIRYAQRVRVTHRQEMDHTF